MTAGSMDILPIGTTYCGQTEAVGNPCIIIGADWSEHDMMDAIESSGVLDFWNDPSENIYE